MEFQALGKCSGKRQGWVKGKFNIRRWSAGCGLRPALASLAGGHYGFAGAAEYCFVLERGAGSGIRDLLFCGGKVRAVTGGFRFYELNLGIRFCGLKTRIKNPTLSHKTRQGWGTLVLTQWLGATLATGGF